MSDSIGGMTDLDDMKDMEMIMQQLRYKQLLQEQEAESSNRRNYIYRERDVAEERLITDNFGDHPQYPAYYFRKRYRMSRKLFLEIVVGFQEYLEALIVCTGNGKIVSKNGTGNMREVTLEEIKEAVWDCGSSKALGPDGYSFAFVKKYWGTIQKDLYDFVNLFFATCVMPNGANSSFSPYPKGQQPIP
ncbi:hypothetical protein Tco_0817290 [Tanacetum coccineum]